MDVKNEERLHIAPPPYKYRHFNAIQMSDEQNNLMGNTQIPPTHLYHNEYLHNKIKFLHYFLVKIGLICRKMPNFASAIIFS